MPRTLHRRALLLAALIPALSFAVIIDKIVVTVGTQAITESELELALRLTAFMNQQPLDFGTAARRSTVERLIEKKLILKELDFSKLPRPSMSEVEPRIASTIQSLFQGDRAAYQAALQKYGITEDDLKEYRLWMLTFFRFLDFRFRPGIQVSEQEIEDYFRSTILPLAQKAKPGQPVTLDEYHDRIERILLARREDQQLEIWLKDQRARAKIEYRDDSLKPGAAK